MAAGHIFPSHIRGDGQRGFKFSKSAPPPCSEVLPSARLHLCHNLPKHRPNLGTKCSNTWAGKGHLSFKPPYLAEALSQEMFVKILLLLDRLYFQPSHRVFDRVAVEILMKPNLWFSFTASILSDLLMISLVLHPDNFPAVFSSSRVVFTCRIVSSSTGFLSFSPNISWTELCGAFLGSSFCFIVYMYHIYMSVWPSILNCLDYHSSSRADAQYSAWCTSTVACWWPEISFQFGISASFVSSAALKEPGKSNSRVSLLSWRRA